jgi:cysteine desulfurase
VVFGGGQERGLRSGTLNVPGIVGFAKALGLAVDGLEEEAKRIEALRERLREGILKRLEDVEVHGSLSHRLPGNLNVSFHFAEGESLLRELSKDIAVSTGSACASRTAEPSHVLKALGAREDVIHSSIRFGLGRFNTQEEVDYVLERVVECVDRLRKDSPLYRAYREGAVRRSEVCQRVL